MNIHELVENVKEELLEMKEPDFENELKTREIRMKLGALW